ncbi:MAG: ATP-binding protein [Oscillospiraceae bacterium]|nr:ATP-binding protein [Oscillospiraceae bacterium]
MGYSKNILDKAFGEVERRRSEALYRADKRIAEVARVCPEIERLRRDVAGVSVQLNRLIQQKPECLEEALEELKTANLSSQEKIAELLQRHGYDREYLTYKPYCELCQDSGYSGGAICRCVKNIISTINYKELAGKSALAECSFDNFELSYYPKEEQNIPIAGYGSNQRSAVDIPYEVMKDIYDYCRDWAENFTLKSNSILMFGQTGLGKTHLSLAIIKRVIEKGWNAVYFSAGEFVRKAQDEQFGRDGGNALSSAAEADIFVLDDLGTEFETKFSVAAIYDTVNTRMNRNLPTIISTNLDISELESRYSQRIISRLMGDFILLQFAGRDIRQIKSRN